MSPLIEMDPVTRITAGAVGEPGERTFFIQARSGETLVTLLAEKQQVQILSTTLTQLLEALPEIEDEGVPPSDDDLELEEPLLPEWRIGPMTLEIDEARNFIVLVAQEASAPAEESEEEEESEPAPEIEEDLSRARFVATRAQMRALAEHAERVCAAGRPRCNLCGFPLDPEGHSCPALNGHRTIDS